MKISKDQKNEFDKIKREIKIPVFQKMKTNFPSLVFHSSFLKEDTEHLKGTGFVFCNFKKPISCFDVGDFVAVGFKSDLLPFNIFEIKEGPSLIYILNKELKTINECRFNYGDVISLRFIGCHLYALFGNGDLRCFNIEKDTLVEAFYINSNIPSNNRKIVAFDGSNGILAYTNGIDIFINMGSISLGCPIINLVVGVDRIYILHITNKLYEIDFDLKNYREVFARALFVRLLKTSTTVIALDVEGNHRVIPSKFKIVTFFSGLYDGIIKSYKIALRRSIVEDKIQIINSNGGKQLLTDNFNKDYKCFIPNVMTHKDYFIYATEDGILFKGHFE